MKIKIILERTNNLKVVKLKEGTTVKNLLKKLSLKPDTIIVMKEEIPIPIDYVLNYDQELTIIQVSSGG